MTSLKDVAARLNAEPTAEDAAIAMQHFREEVPERDHNYTARDVSIRLLAPSKTNPRRSVDDAALKQLAESIEAVGILQPLVVREMPNDSPHEYEIVCGHRRYLAAKLAGLKDVPVEVRELTDVQVLEVQLVENLQREDIHPLDEAEGFARLRDEARYTPEQIAERVGKSVAWVYARLKLTSLAPEAREAFYADELAASVAVPLARLPHAQQAKALKRIAEMGAREAIDWLQKEFCRSLKGAPFDTKDALLTEAGACTKCPKRSGSTPGLFDDIAESNVCTDTACYAEKATAAWSQRTEKAAKKGHEVLTLNESAKLYKAGALAYGSKFVEADAPAANDKQKRTWRELVAKLPEGARPSVTVAAGAKGKPIELYPADATLAAVAEHLKLAWAVEREEREETVAKRDDPSERAKEELARGVRERVAEELLAFAGAVAEKEGPTLKLLRLAVRVCVEHGAAEDAIVRRGVEKSLPWIEKKADAHNLWGVLFEACFVGVARDTWSEFTDDIKALAEVVGFDLVAASKAALATAEAESTQPKKGKR